MDEVVLLVTLIMVGFVAQVVFKRILNLAEEFEKVVKKLVNTVYYVLIPLAFVKTYVERGLAVTDVWIALSFLLFMTLAFASVKRIAGKRKGGYVEALVLTSIFPNSVFLGFPVSMALFNTIRVASMMGLVTLTLNVALPDFMALKKFSIRKILTLPAIVGFVVGVIGHYFASEIIPHVSSILWWAPPLLSYSAIFTLGARLPLSLKVLKSNIYFILTAGIYRFIVAPLVSYATVLAVGIDWFDGLQLIVVSMMPPAVMNTLMAQKHGWKPELVAGATVTLTFAFLAFLPILNLLIP